MTRQKIQDLIAKGRVKDALALADSYYKNDSSLSTQVSLLQARFSRNESQQMMGVLSRSEYTQESNGIVYALLNIASEEPSNPEPEPAKPELVISTPKNDPVVNTQTQTTQAVPSSPPPSSGGIKVIELFLASSSELKDDRKEVEIWINRENNKLVTKGMFLKLNLWEDFLDAMSENRKQGDYNKAVVQSDIFISLYATKVGKYTEEEFETAYQSFKANGKPKYIYTYFKKVQLDTSNLNMEHLNSLKNFQKKLSDLGHFYTRYESTPDLLRQLDNQLDKILEDMGMN